jgi:hypothetical protein
MPIGDGTRHSRSRIASRPHGCAGGKKKCTSAPVRRSKGTLESSVKMSMKRQGAKRVRTAEPGAAHGAVER